MLHAARLKDKSATVEHARLLWKDGHHRKAIQTLKGAIAANEFSANLPSGDAEPNQDQHQNMLAARVWFSYIDGAFLGSRVLIHPGSSPASEMDR